MLSAPAPTAMSLSPSRMCCAAETIACRPLPHRRFTVRQGVPTGNPASIAATRDMYMSRASPWITLPTTTCPTVAGSIFARATASLMAIAPSFVGPNVLERAAVVADRGAHPAHYHHFTLCHDCLLVSVSPDLRRRAALRFFCEPTAPRGRAHPRRQSSPAPNRRPRACHRPRRAPHRRSPGRRRAERATAPAGRTSSTSTLIVLPTWRWRRRALIFSCSCHQARAPLLAHFVGQRARQLVRRWRPRPASRRSSRRGRVRPPRGNRAAPGIRLRSRPGNPAMKVLRMVMSGQIARQARMRSRLSSPLAGRFMSLRMRGSRAGTARRGRGGSCPRP